MYVQRALSSFSVFCTYLFTDFVTRKRQAVKPGSRVLGGSSESEVIVLKRQKFCKSVWLKQLEVLVCMDSCEHTSSLIISSFPREHASASLSLD